MYKQYSPEELALWRSMTKRRSILPRVITTGTVNGHPYNKAEQTPSTIEEAEFCR
jgi:hypothetical protein